MIWIIKNGLDFKKAATISHDERVPYIDMGFSHATTEDMISPRVFKSHLPIKYLPDDLQNKSESNSSYYCKIYSLNQRKYKH